MYKQTIELFIFISQQNYLYIFLTLQYILLVFSKIICKPHLNFIKTIL